MIVIKKIWLEANQIAQGIIDSLSTREIAVLFWVLIFLIFAVSKEEIRKSFGQVLHAFFKYNLVFITLLTVVYVYFGVFFLKKVNLWVPYLLKDTILWFLFSGCVLIVNSVRDVEASEMFFRRVILDNIKIILLLELMVNTYTFRFWIELILVPTIALIAGIATYAQYRQEFKNAAKVLYWIQAFSGFAVLYFAGMEMTREHENILSLEALRKLSLPLLLTVLFLPYLYLVVLFAKYEDIFIRLDMGKEKTSSVKRYAKLQIFLRLKLSLTKLLQFSKYIGVRLMRIESKEDVDLLLREYREVTY